MTTPQHLRSVLSEIPDRYEGLIAAALTPSTRFADEPMVAAAAAAAITMPNNQMLLDNQVANMSLNQLEYQISPLPSPDELVIRQRGRRRFTMNWSPDKTPTPAARSPFQRTPTKVMTSGMILRSSPRKRLAMGTTPPDSLFSVGSSPSKTVASSPLAAGAAERASPRKHNNLSAAKTQLWPGTPVVKKLRTDDRPLGQLSGDTSLPVLLTGLSQQQLVDIIARLAQRDGRIEEEVRNEMPLPDISHLEQELSHCKRNIFKSLPTSRLCKKTDSASYARAVTHLSEFKRLLMSQAKQLYDSTHWDALLDYVFMAWNCVRATPIWDNAIHNTVRRQCFKVLSCHCIAAVKYGGLRLGAQRLHTLERHLQEWSKDYEDVLSCVNALNKTLIKSRNSL